MRNFARYGVVRTVPVWSRTDVRSLAGRTSRLVSHKIPLLPAFSQELTAGNANSARYGVVRTVPVRSRTDVRSLARRTPRLVSHKIPLLPAFSQELTVGNA